MTEGRTLALYGDSDSGKTTQFGELAKFHFKQTGRQSRLNTADRGKYGSIQSLVRLGVVVVNELQENDDPWVWVNHATSNRDGDFALEGFDSATSISEGLLDFCANAAYNIGTSKSQKFVVGNGKDKLTIGATNEGHYLVVQNFMLNQMWKSTWLVKNGTDVLWTFATLRGETSDKAEIVGPMMGAGKALTPKIPKWFEYTFRLVTIPELDKSARHVLYLQPQPDMLTGSVSFGNSRYPINADTPLPASIEPASVVEALRLIENGKEEAYLKDKEELGM